MDVKDQIQKLIALQKVDKEVFDLKIDLEEKPKVIELIKGSFEQKKVKLGDLEGKFKKVQLYRRDQELDLKGKEDAIAKANGQLSLLKTNKEYHAKQSEIESLKADKSIIEEKILISYDDGENITKEIDAEKKILAQDELELNTKKKVVDDELARIKSRLVELEAQRKVLVVGVDVASLNRYEKILAKKDGVAIVPIQGSACGGCYMNVTQQHINDIKMMMELRFCGNCTRILYLEDK